MNTTASAIYDQLVVHRRLKPRRHRLKYRMFQLLLDLDEVDRLDDRLLLFSRNRFNFFSFYDRDHGDGSGTSLRRHVERSMRASGIKPDDGPIRLLTMPRIFGYVFNPLSVYFCYQRTGALQAILYEVGNTFGQRHEYLFPVDGHEDQYRHACAKDFYVSPFLEMALGYSFKIRPPENGVVVAIVASDPEGPVLTAALTGRRRPLSDAALLKTLVVYPLLTVKVIAAIHWEALRIWLKGVPVQPRPGSNGQGLKAARDERWPDSGTISPGGR